MSTLIQDVRYAARVLRKSPGAAATAILTLALGIGLNTALFSVIRAVLLAPLPYPRPNELLQISESHGQRRDNPVSRLNFEDWRSGNRTLQYVAAYSPELSNAAGGSTPVRIHGALVSADFFPMLETSPEIGRTFAKEEQRLGASHVLVIGHSLWQRAFAADPRVLGRTLRLDGLTFTIIGVMPSGFNAPESSEFWASLESFPDTSSRSAHNYSVIARLKPGRSPAEAQQDLDALSAGIRRRDPSDRDMGAAVMLLHEALVGNTRPAFLVLFGALIFVLLIACVNVANLQLAKASERSRELALRTAIGATRGRLVRQLLTESTLLALAGGFCGLLMALWSTELLDTLVPPEIPRIAAIHIDRAALVFTLAMTCISGLLFGIFPALGGTRIELNDALKEGSAKTSGGLRSRTSRRILLVSEVALAMILLVGAGLLLQSFRTLQGVRPGFQSSGVVTAEVSWPLSNSEGGADEAAIVPLYHRLFDRLRAIPGVEAVAATSSLPVKSRCCSGGFRIEGRPPAKDGLTSYYHVVTPDYFGALRIPLVRGRLFTEHDDAARPQVAVINETMARRIFPNEDPIGQRIFYFGFDRKPQPLAITGIVGDVRQFGLNLDPRPQAYVNYLQHPQRLMYADLVVRAVPTEGLTAAITAAVHAESKDVPVTIEPMDQVVARSLASRRFQMLLLGLFAALALVLAAVGIYGVLSYFAGQRTAEFGIRMALGARPSQVLMAVEGEGLRLVATGLAAGAFGAALLTSTISRFLYGIKPTDPLTFCAVALLLFTVAALAGYFPARRATRIDPAVALRNE